MALARVLLIQGKGRDAQYVLTGVPCEQGVLTLAQTLKPLPKRWYGMKKAQMTRQVLLTPYLKRPWRWHSSAICKATLDGLLTILSSISIIGMDGRTKSTWPSC